MTKNIIVIGKYPNLELSKDGMMQRTIEIDDLLSEVSETSYIDISFKNSWLTYSTTEIVRGRPIKIRHVNIFIHQFFIYRILKKSDAIYIHSMLNYFLAFPALNFVNRILFLDIHGVVPEEYLFMGKKIRSIIYSIVERMAFRKSMYFIAVTAAMEKYYLQKYHWLQRDKFIRLPIFDKPTTVESDNIKNKNTVNRDKRHIESLLSVIYAGGIQPWQNIDLMVEISNAFNGLYNFKFYVPKNAIDILKSKMGNDKFIVGSLSKSELVCEYSSSDLGFLLRDDIIVNRVASPTKLGEYIKNGVIPVVIDSKIGDIEHYGYNVVTINDLISLNLPSREDLLIMANQNEHIYDTIYLKDVQLGRQKLLQVIEEKC